MKVAKVILAIALLGGLLLAGSRVYRRLPDGSPSSSVAGQSSLHIVINNAVRNASLNSPVELYPFDFVAAQREYEASPKLARQFDDFLTRRLHDIAPVKADVNGEGRALATLARGKWWLRATAVMESGEAIEWRLPLEVRDRDQLVQLTLENAYEKTKKF